MVLYVCNKYLLLYRPYQRQERKNMLKASSKKAKENLKNYIINCWVEDPENARPIDHIKLDIISHFEREAYYSDYERRQSRYYQFNYWLRGLPRGLGDFCLCKAVDDLGAILEETEEEKARFTEEQAAEKLSNMIYNFVYFD